MNSHVPTLMLAMETSMMLQKLPALLPEIFFTVGAIICMILGLTRSLKARRATLWVAALVMIFAGLFFLFWPAIYPQDSATFLPASMVFYVKLAVIVMGGLLLMVAASVPDYLKLTRQLETAPPAKDFDAGDVVRGEFYAFFLLSLTGVMLVAGATDLVWLFLALELVSLPTYVMVAIGRDRGEAQESGVKYFFLGAMAVAVFLYGFALIYGATGSTELHVIRDYATQYWTDHQSLPPLLITGLLLSVLGVSFKIAAFPMHFYVADVYQGASTPVTAFLAFVPKTAGFVALIILLSLVGWPLPDSLEWMLWTMAVLTMTIGNVLGLLQTNVKRVLAYSSIAHSGYMLVGLLIGPGSTGHALGDGLAAILFYLVSYGLATTAGFAIIGCFRTRDDDEAEMLDDLNGLARRNPRLAAVLLISLLSLVGLPPLGGFIGKLYLFGSAIQADHVLLVVIAVLNSAIGAVYYLRIVAAVYFADPSGQCDAVPLTGRGAGAAVAALGVIVLGLFGSFLVQATHEVSPPASVSADPTSGLPDLSDLKTLPPRPPTMDEMITPSEP